MMLHLSRLLSIGGAATVGAAMLCAAGAGAAAASTVPDDPVETAAGCAEITDLLDAEEELGTAYLADDGETVGAIVLALPALGDAAVAAAPPEIVDAVAAWIAPLADLATLTEGVDVTDLDALVGVMASAPPTPESEAAGEEVTTWASEHCGWVASMDDFGGQVAEPQPCELLDVGAAVAAAGVEIDITDDDGTGDFDLGFFWTKSCSYGNGALTLSTLSFTDLAQVTDFYLQNLGDDGAQTNGEVLDVDLGSLPASTLVTAVDGTVTVSVFEATVPFSVTLGGDVEPGAVVAAAEAVVAALPAEVPPPPMTSEAP